MFLYYAFNYAFTTWNMWLYCALLYFSFALRTLSRPGNTSSCTHLGLVNFGLTILAISPLSLLRLPGFALGSFWTHIVAVWYACVVLITMTHGRLVQMSADPATSDALATVMGMRRVFVTFEDGYFGLHCTSRVHGTTGHVWVLNAISVGRSPLLDQVVQVYAEEQVWEWIRMFPRRVRWDEKGKVGERGGHGGGDDAHSFYGQVRL
ncbi:hypothetical protein BCR44DRAFT_1434435 [Catenaria anguillulae PL171]|uniref:Uncharacterized protein n=1 Tax=Catenaria anguillulae PL171 TaxID=765915 RepID=A0A1Y2HLP7_9FUNG|nr:hypothetical protein BCR44DRAFT_1434435 [Catenaria anguillulae PL171]